MVCLGKGIYRKTSNRVDINNMETIIKFVAVIILCLYVFKKILFMENDTLGAFLLIVTCIVFGILLKVII